MISNEKSYESSLRETVDTSTKNKSDPLSPIEQKVVIVANKKIFMQHDTGPGHCESPGRVEAIENALKAAGLMNKKNTIKPRKAREKEIALCHSQKYIEELKKQIKELTVPSKAFESFAIRFIPGDFQISKKSYTTALYAAGAPLKAIEYINDPKNDTKRAFCIVRPPGHHAHRDTGSGFCALNTVATAALSLVASDLKVVIIDWDAHHGDGTQELVEENERVFYFSTHQDTAEGFYPGEMWGHKEDTGKYKNVMNRPVSGSQEDCRHGILAAFEEFEKAMDQFQPDFVLISCGFDAHQNDTLVGLGLTDEDYVHMTECAIRIADKYAKGRIVSVLEGGYNLEAISGAAKVHVEALKK